MSAQSQNPNYLNQAFEDIIDLFAEWVSNFKHNTTHMFADVKLKQWIRIIVIICTYLLVRPHLIKFGARQQEKQHEKDAAEAAANGVELTPNDLRGGGGGKKKVRIELPGVDSDEEAEKRAAKPAEWGRKATVRQRKAIRKVLEKEEERRRSEQEAESDKEIEKFLVD